MLNQRRSGEATTFWNLCFGKRVAEEFYNVATDPDCTNNLIKIDAMKQQIAALRKQMLAELSEQGDPRINGNEDVFDQYPYSGKSTDNFYERYMRGDKPKAGWVNESDFEKAPLD